MFVVNRSGFQIPVWEDHMFVPPTCNGTTVLRCTYDKSRRAGTLLVNEFSIRAGLSGARCEACFMSSWMIRFLSLNGFRTGWMHSDDARAGWDTSILAVPFERQPINGVSWPVYRIQNRAEGLHRQNGSWIEDLAIGTEIATDSATTGQTLVDHWLIRWVKRNGVWTPADQTGNTFGFVDTGLQLGSGPNTISIRTSLAA